MLFNSLEYFLFLPLILFLFYLIPHRYRWMLLLPASYFFYMYWRPEYGLLLLISTTVDYYAAIAMHRQKTKRAKRPYLWISVASNLLLLGTFKYLGFFNELVRDVFSVFDFGTIPSQLNLLLPVGISFYTFQTLSYTLDIYRNRRKPERHFGIFALYVSFFPQLVAGPIERSTTLLPQLRKRQSFQINRLVSGGKLFVWGLFKKIIIADTLGIYVYQVFQNPAGYDSYVLLFILLAFGAQLYLDFSAYTDMAIGSARALGFDLMSNFERPFRATSLRQFWSRWHITLTSWFFDYVYRPLAKGWRWPWFINLLIVFVLIGIWHGSGWNFIAFGFINGIGYIISMIMEEVHLSQTGLFNLIKKRVLGILQLAVMYTSLVTSAIFFRTDNFNKAKDFIYQLTHDVLHTFNGLDMQSIDIFILITTFPVFFLVHWQKSFDSQKPLDGIKRWWVRWSVYYYIIFYLIFFGGRLMKDFIYFQF